MELPATTLIKAIQQHLSLPGETFKIGDIKLLTAQDRDDLTEAFEKMGQPILKTRSSVTN